MSTIIQLTSLDEIVTCFLLGFHLDDTSQKICSAIVNENPAGLDVLNITDELRAQIYAHFNIDKELLEELQWSSWNC